MDVFQAALRMRVPDTERLTAATNEPTQTAKHTFPADALRDLRELGNDDVERGEPR